MYVIIQLLSYSMHEVIVQQKIGDFILSLYKNRCVYIYTYEISEHNCQFRELNAFNIACKRKDIIILLHFP